jgi:flagellar protein FlaJ
MVMLTRFSSMGGLGAATAEVPGLPVVQYEVGIPPVVWHATLLQAFFSGLIAGQFSTGRLMSGLKHSIIMMVVAFCALSLLA